MGSIKAMVNYHTNGPMEEGKEYVDYKVIRGKTIVNSQHILTDSNVKKQGYK